MPLNIPIEQIQFPPNIPAGCNILVIASLAYALRTSNDPVTPPILVQPEGTPEDPRWSITDGRHRVIASIVAGRTTVSAEIG